LKHIALGRRIFQVFRELSNLGGKSVPSSRHFAEVNHVDRFRVRRLNETAGSTDALRANLQTVTARRNVLNLDFRLRVILASTVRSELQATLAEALVPGGTFIQEDPVDATFSQKEAANGANKTETTGRGCRTL
jgi:hypothetical protein